MPSTVSSYNLSRNYLRGMEAAQKLQETINVQQALLASFTDACCQVRQTASLHMIIFLWV